MLTQWLDKLTGEVIVKLSLDHTDQTEGRYHNNACKIHQQIILVVIRAFDTHKLPSAKIPIIAIFCDVGICNFQMSGIGKRRSTTSVAMLGIATPKKYLRSSIHFEAMCFSQNPLTGMQEKMPANNCHEAHQFWAVKIGHGLTIAINQPITLALMIIRGILVPGTLKIRR